MLALEEIDVASVVESRPTERHGHVLQDDDASGPTLQTRSSSLRVGGRRPRRSTKRVKEKIELTACVDALAAKEGRVVDAGSVVVNFRFVGGEGAAGHICERPGGTHGAFKLHAMCAPRRAGVFLNIPAKTLATFESPAGPARRAPVSFVLSQRKCRDSVSTDSLRRSRAAAATRLHRRSARPVYRRRRAPALPAAAGASLRGVAAAAVLSSVSVGAGVSQGGGARRRRGRDRGRGAAAPPRGHQNDCLQDDLVRSDGPGRPVACSAKW